MHFVEAAGGETGSVKFSSLAEDDCVAMSSVRDVHRHASRVQVRRKRPVLEAAVGYRPDIDFSLGHGLLNF